jgi:hypothetical protein
LRIDDRRDGKAGRDQDIDCRNTEASRIAFIVAIDSSLSG